MPILGFSPGLPSNAPGIVTDCENFIPYDAGMEAAPSAVDLGYSAVPAAATGAFSARKLSGSVRPFVGTDTAIYEYTGGLWVMQNQSASAYVAGSVWQFCQFGDATIAANYGNTIQASSASSFSAIVGAPKARLVESVVTGSGGFVFAADTDDASYGVSPDRWWCSALNDHTSWTVSAATQATTGRLIGGGGKITALKKFGADSIVAYKDNALFHGRYVGGSTVWAFNEVPEVGAVGRRAVADIGMVHFIVSKSGFWLYDGARPTRIGEQVRDWFANSVDYSYIDSVEVQYDQPSNRVFVFYRAPGTAVLNRVLVWHVGTNQWGKMTQPIETTVRYVTPGVTYATDVGTYNGGAADPYDSGPVAREILAVINTSHKLCTINGTPGASWFQTADHGDVNKSSRCRQVFLEYAIRPVTASCTMYTSFAMGGVELVGTTTSAHDEIGSANMPGRFPVRSHGRYHRAELSFTGQCRVTGYVVPLEAAGSR